MNLCITEKVEKGVLFAHSSVSMTRLVNRLNELGIKSDKLLNQMDYREMTLGKEEKDDKETTQPQETVNEKIASQKVVQQNTFQESVEKTTQEPTPITHHRAPVENPTLICATEYEARGLDFPNVS